MKGIDNVYGKYEISEPVILEIIKSPFFQRLKGVSQAGYYLPYVFHKPVTRYEHSLGCYILLSNFNLSLEECIFGLIHDVSHSTFSHCIDYMFGNDGKKQVHQDNIFKKYIFKTDIPKILEKYNIDVNFILEESNFIFQERGLPDLCADRIDYSLRDGLALGEITKKQIKLILHSLKIINNNWCFDNCEIAKEYATYFNKLNTKHYCGVNSAVMFKRVENYLNHAINLKYINLNDLYKTDKEVILKINNFLKKDERLKVLWNEMNNSKGFMLDEDNYNIQVDCKSRVVDPLILKEGKLIKLSQLDKNWKELIKKEMKPKKFLINMKVI